MTREEYFAADAISRSLLMELRKHPTKAKRMIEEGMNETSDALRLGDAFDCMMFDSQEIVDERFHVMQLSNPYSGTTTQGRFINKMIPIASQGFPLEDNYATAYGQAGLAKTKQEAFITDFKGSEGEMYLKEIIMSRGKIVLEKEEHDKLVLMQRILRSDPNFGKYFVNDLIKDQMRYKISEHEEVIYQLVVFWDECKVMLDIVYINHETKIIRPIDLKTTSVKDHEVQATVIKYDYVYQAAMYHLGISHWRDNNYPDYTIGNFSFIFSEKSISFAPIEMEVSERDLTGALNGGFDKVGKYHTGIFELIKELKWHQKHNKWEYRKNAYDTKGTIMSDIFTLID